MELVMLLLLNETLTRLNQIVLQLIDRELIDGRRGQIILNGPALATSALGAISN